MFSLRDMKLAAQESESCVVYWSHFAFSEPVDWRVQAHEVAWENQKKILKHAELQLRASV